MNVYYKINYNILPDFIIKFVHYRLYVKNLSEFTVYYDVCHLKSFLRFLICLHSKIDSKDFCSYYKNIKDFRMIKIRWLKNFTLEQMLEYVEFISNDLKYEAHTKANTILIVKTLFDYLHKIFGCLKENKFKDLPVPRFRVKTVTYMSKDECIKFLSVVDTPRDKAIINLLLNTGARRCEVTNALLSNLDLSNKTLLVVR